MNVEWIDQHLAAIKGPNNGFRKKREVSNKRREQAAGRRVPRR
jgi:hypothetical protein